MNDTEGFVGYLPSDNSIYVAFRGSLSIQNWITDLNIDKVKYKTRPECNCQVHEGFYNATLSVFDAVLAEVKRLKALYPSYSVKTTGHSLGGAIAQLTAMELINAGIDTTMINFGQPRVGDEDYATFSNNFLKVQYRVVHNRDIVPHNPGQIWPLNFKHCYYEEFEDKNGNVRQCDNSGEDKTCSDGIDPLFYSIPDHLQYLGKCMGVLCEECGILSD